MKTLIISLGLVLIVLTGFTQHIPVNVINKNYKMLELENGTIKFLKYQEKDKNLIILNHDQSIWKKIDLPLSVGHFLDEVKSISTTVFNKDSLVEIVYISVEYDYSYEYENPFNPNAFITFALNIINEKGEILMREKGITDYIIVELNGEKELFVFKNQDNNYNKKAKTVEFAISK